MFTLLKLFQPVNIKNKKIEEIFITAFSLLMIFTLSCNSKSPEQLIIGTWTLNNVINTTDTSVTDKITFYKNDSLLIEIIVNNKIENRYAGTYNISGDNKYITSLIEKFPPQKFEIITLSDKRLELRLIGKKHIDQYKRM